jgi:FKBP-type peptidyl-prolyl cis-trans isomerase
MKAIDKRRPVAELAVVLATIAGLAEVGPPAWPPSDAPAANSLPAAGLAITVIRPGRGEPLRQGDSAKLHVTIWLDGFDGKKRLAQPGANLFVITVGSGQALPGLDRGVVGMKPGGIRRLQVGPAMAYGPNPCGALIPANATLYFEVHFVGLVRLYHRLPRD